MNNTVGRRTLESLRRFSAKMLRKGTHRRDFCDLAVKSLKTIRYQGWKAFFEKVRDRRNRYVAPPAFVIPDISRSVSNIKSAKLFVTPRRFRILFLISPWAGVTNRYRAHNMKEYLRLAEIESEVISLEEVEAKLSDIFNFDVMVIHRISMNKAISALIRKCKELCIPVVFDLDDYIFDDSLVNRIDEIKRMCPRDRNAWIEHVRGCRKTLDASDYYIGTTEFLARKVEELGKKAFVVRNGLNATQIRQSLSAFQQIEREPDLIKIGYFSGTRSHQKDFEVVKPVLLRLMEEFNAVRLYIGGFLDLDHGFDNFSHRIERFPYVDWKELPLNLAKIDINIAPLEQDNPFCEGKSELKYFETALLKIPTVATPVDAYKWAIRSGENGLLASTEEEWYTHLKSLIENPVLRRTLGEKAFEKVMETYTPESQAEKAKTVYENIIRDYRERKGINEGVLSISFIVTSISDENNFERLLIMARDLSDKGHFVKIYVNRNSAAPDQKGAKLKDICRESKFDLVSPPFEVVCCDALIAADPESLETACAYADRFCKLFYSGHGKIPRRSEHFIRLNTATAEELVKSFEPFLKDTRRDDTRKSSPRKALSL